MRHGSLFSGIGGFDLASEWMGWENVFQCEWDPYCQKVLKKNFPNVELHGNIKEFKGQPVDILTGGFPCQPFSQAGNRSGESDERYLWPEMLRIIRESKPAFVVGENVAGLITMDNGRTLDTICLDLENEGYQVELFVIPACGVGAWHRRERIWIIAHNDSFGHKQKLSLQTRNKGEETEPIGSCENVPDTHSQRLQRHRKEYQLQKDSKKREIAGCDWWTTEPRMGRVADGVPKRMDRLKGLGNAIVPQVAYEIFKAIEQTQIHISSNG